MMNNDELLIEQIRIYQEEGRRKTIRNYLTFGVLFVIIACVYFFIKG
jgi:hypothetical protein